MNPRFRIWKTEYPSQHWGIGLVWKNGEWVHYPFVWHGIFGCIKKVFEHYKHARKHRNHPINARKQKK